LQKPPAYPPGLRRRAHQEKNQNATDSTDFTDLKTLSQQIVKHVRTGLETRPDFQSYNRLGGTALESRPHMFK
jgi:hypothetical protein